MNLTKSLFLILCCVCAMPLGCEPVNRPEQISIA